jgi:ribonuclease HI
MIEIYADGSCLVNHGGPGGYAAIILTDGRENRRVTGHEARSTAPRAELLGIIAGLEALTEPSVVAVYSDSQTTNNCAA